MGLPSLSPLALHKQLDNVLSMRVEQPGRGQSESTHLSNLLRMVEEVSIKPMEGLRNSFFILGVNELLRLDTLTTLEALFQ